MAGTALAARPVISPARCRQQLPAASRSAHRFVPGRSRPSARHPAAVRPLALIPSVETQALLLRAPRSPPRAPREPPRDPLPLLLSEIHIPLPPHFALH